MKSRWLAATTTAALAATVLVAAGGGAGSANEGERISSLGVPLQDVLLVGGTVAPGPGGRTVLWSASSGAPAHLNAVDPATGEAIARLDLPGAGGSWAVDSAPDGSVYVGTYGGSKLFRWTAATGVVDLGKPIASETFVWDVATDEQSIVYGGTSPNGKLFSYNPGTGQYRDYGQLSPGHQYVRSLAVYQGKIYAGTNPPAKMFEVDIATGAKRQLPDPPGRDVTADWVYDVDIVGDHLYVRYGTAFPNPLFVYDLVTGQWIDRIDNVHGLEVPPADEQGRVYLIRSGELIRYDPGDGSETGTGMPFIGRVANSRGIGWAELGLPDYPGRSIVGLLWRGMMFRYNPTTGARSFVPTTIAGEPIDITALAEGPDGRVYAGGFLNGGFAAVHPDTGRTEEFHTFSQSEDMLGHGGRLYIGAYPDARVYSYDPTKPWNSSEYSPSPEPVPDQNPLRLFDLKPELQIRPRALVGAGNLLAVGTMPDLGHLGGVLAIWDTTTGALISKTRHVVTDQSIVSLAYRDGVIYGGTSIYSGQSATLPTQPEAKVFAWSVAEGRKLWEMVPAPGKPTIPALTFDGQGRLWGIAGGEVFAVDTASRQVTVRHTYSGSTSGSGQLAYNAVDEMLYGVLTGNEVFRLDLASGQKHVLRSGAATHLAVHSNGDVYFSSGSQLFRYDLPAGPCPHPDPSATVTIRDVDSGVPNRATANGCTVDDLIKDEADWPHRGGLTAHVAVVSTRLARDGVITWPEATRLVVTAARYEAQ
ncbi:PQQ-binding-like beta-propeller repeat protein [Allorhizocola rhizosphaerae]|uniref:PQQ-binding-like beta-propeller repeat protein n=1 Tax=Allorhizocola rhizosphaerae TaxID=1872709 RepID=UPI001B8B7E14|nr:PQQ-binding-like beta-propeller repeat protein [Allorhizocola rhizosphaerae]